MELVAVAAVTAAGGLVAKDQGVVRRTILFDTEGDGQPGDVRHARGPRSARGSTRPSTTCAQSRRS